MGKFDGCLFVSDVDATLLRADQTVSDANKRSIEYFINEGGRFTIATGRMVGEVQNIWDQVMINAPLILHNGSKVYDFESGVTIWEKFIEEERKDRIRRFHDEISECGIEIYSGETVYIYRSCGDTQRFFKSICSVVYEMPDFVWEEPWQKVLIIGDTKEMLDRCGRMYRTEYDGGNCVRNGPKYLGVVANGASKAAGMKITAEKLGCKTLISIGDSENDVDMLKASDVSFAVENAVDAVKATAKYTAAHFENDAVAYAINKLEEIIGVQGDKK